MSQQQAIQSLSNESKIQLANIAIQKSQFQSVRATAKLYDAPRTTLRDRRAGKQARRDCLSNSRRLTDLEEKILVERILDLDSRGKPPTLKGVAAMANYMLAVKGKGKVGKNWPTQFIKRHPELKTRMNRKYDIQRAQQEDPDVIYQWFELVRNTRAKYGIQPDDEWNFDETGFMMGIIGSMLVVTGSERRNQPKSIQPGNREWVTAIQGVNALGSAIPPFIIFKGVQHIEGWYQENDLPSDWPISLSPNGWTTDELGLEWIQHFERHTKDKTKGSHRLLFMDGHGSHETPEFERFCDDHDIITLTMPAHSSHLLQPLDVGCFAPLKKAYGQQIDALIRNHVNHVSKLEFIPAFRDAFFASITSSNIQGGFRGAGLHPFNPDAVISKLDVRLRTPILSSDSEAPWSSKTPAKYNEFESQSNLIKDRFLNHPNSSPSKGVGAAESALKGTLRLISENALLKEEIKALKAAVEAASKRRQRSKRQIQKRGTLTAQDVSILADQRDANMQIQRETIIAQAENRASAPRRRRCGYCKEPGHRIETCPVRLAEGSDSESQISS